MTKEMISYKEASMALLPASGQTLSFMMDDIFAGKANKDLSDFGGVKKLREDVDFGGKKKGMYIPTPENVSKELLAKLLDKGLIALKDSASKDVFEPTPKATEEPDPAAAMPKNKPLETAR